MNIRSFLFFPEPASRPGMTGGVTAKGIPAEPEGGFAGSLLLCMESMEGDASPETVSTARTANPEREGARGPAIDEGEGAAVGVVIDGEPAAPVPPGVAAEPMHVGASEADGKGTAQEKARGEVIIGGKEEWIRLFGDSPFAEATRAAGSGLAVSRGAGARMPAMNPGSAALSEEAVPAGRSMSGADGEPLSEAEGQRGKSTVSPERPAEGAREERIENPEGTGKAGRPRSAVDFSERGSVVETLKVETEGERTERAFRAEVRADRSGGSAPAEAENAPRGAERGGLEKTGEARAAERGVREPAGSPDAVRAGSVDRRIETEKAAPRDPALRVPSSGMDDAGGESRAARAEARLAASEGESPRSVERAGSIREERAGESGIRETASRAAETAAPEKKTAELLRTGDSVRRRTAETGGNEPAPSMKSDAGRPAGGGEARERRIGEERFFVRTEHPAVETVEKTGKPASSESNRAAGIAREDGAESRAPKTETVVRTEGRPAAASSGERPEVRDMKIASGDRTENHAPKIETGDRTENHAPKIETGGRTEARAPKIETGDRTENRAPKIETGGRTEARAPKIETGGRTEARAPEGEMGERIDRSIGTAAVDPARPAVEARAATAAPRGEKTVSLEESGRSVNEKTQRETAEAISSGESEAAETGTGRDENRAFENPRSRMETVRFETEAATAHAARRKEDAAGFRAFETSRVAETAGVKETAEIQATGTIPSSAPETAADRAERALLESRAVRGEILERLTEGTRRLLRSGRNEAEIELDPPELGRLRVKLTVTGASVRGFVEVENPNVQAALQSDLSRLNAALAESGLDLTQFDVLLRHDRRSGDGRGGGSFSDRAFSDEGEGEKNESARGGSPRKGSGSRLVDTWM